MEKMKIIVGFLLVVLIFACQKSSISIKPEILTAEYESKASSEFERGYKIFIVMDKLPQTFIIKGIVCQKRLLVNVNSTKMNETEIFIDQYFPIQSKMIDEFSPPKADTRSDGIIFEMNGKEYFQEIKFKLK